MDIPSPPAPTHVGFFAGLRNVLLFVAALVLAASGIAALLPMDQVQAVGAKWRHFLAHKDEPDVLFVGSSRFYHQIIPPQFDREVAATGVPVKSFNFAVDGCWPPESFYLLRQILAQRPARLRWVVIDLMDINSRIPPENRDTPRVRYWHDLRHTIMALRETWSRVERPASERSDQCLEHVQLFLQNAFSLGRGAASLQTWAFTGKKKERSPVWGKEAGYAAEPDVVMSGEPLANYERLVEKLRKGLRPFPMPPVFYEAVRDIAAVVRASGAEPIFVIAPTVNPRENFSDTPPGLEIWRYNDPMEYPELYRADRHFDDYHLNAAGAVEFTRLLAERFAKAGAAKK